ncbi:hypothetical protein Vadar_027778 [Vaccinium darrowii]|uniref:Uncharacterized protein n=1 Tax=Vaccinium darrowii TaxID=229202 RepID=A0ACB7ZEL2_9ERIC|nr:hypothetical protein Vadar_027778 [Vaccinium darrowii]
MELTIRRQCVENLGYVIDDFKKALGNVAASNSYLLSEDLVAASSDMVACEMCFEEINGVGTDLPLLHVSMSSSSSSADLSLHRDDVHHHHPPPPAVLNQVHADIGISSEAMGIMNSFNNSIFEKLAQEGSSLARVHWDADGGKPLIELNRVLRPEGFFVCNSLILDFEGCVHDFEGFALEDAIGLSLNGDVDVHSIFVVSLPTSHPSFAPQKLLEKSSRLKAPPLPDGPVELFIGILSAGNHFVERMAVWKSWMQHRLINKYLNVKLKMIFIQHPRREVNVELMKEAEFFGDIVLVPYMNTYDLVVLKTVAISKYGVSSLMLFTLEEVMVYVNVEA